MDLHEARKAILANPRCDPTPLPFEIHDLILDHFCIPAPAAWDDRESPQQAENRATLRTYSMVSRSFCSNANSRLFSSVVLRMKAFSRIRNARLVASVIRRFVALLRDSLNFPNLGMIYHIRSFALIIQIDCNLSQADNFLHDATIHHLIDVLHGPNHGVESLALDMGYGKLEYREIYIKHDLLCSFQNIICSPSLKHLRLNGLLGFPRTLLRGTNLKNIELYNTAIQCNGNTLDAPPIITMESIGADESFRLVDLLHSGNVAIDTTSRYQAAFVELKALYFVVHLLKRIPKAINIAANAANTLQTLHIHLFGEWRGQRFSSSPDPIYPFHLLPRLSSLRLSSKTIGLGWHNVIYPFRCILESSTIPESLKMLSVETMASGCFNGRLYQLDKLDEWLAMDSVLMQPMFNAIPQTKIILEYPIYGYQSNEYAELQKNNIEDFLLLDALPNFSESRRGSSLPCISVVVIQRYPDQSSRHQNMNHSESNRKGVTLRCGGRKILDIPC
ncbi:hypothetical protein BJ912DRAFT_942238 [Pholiota molesta]|nr:hypothetical protein BJ912DRAFT_942238 [Pholiota molesta]